MPGQSGHAWSPGQSGGAWSPGQSGGAWSPGQPKDGKFVSMSVVLLAPFLYCDVASGTSHGLGCAMQYAMGPSWDGQIGAKEFVSSGSCGRIQTSWHRGAWAYVRIFPMGARMVEFRGHSAGQCGHVWPGHGHAGCQGQHLRWNSWREAMGPCMALDHRG